MGESRHDSDTHRHAVLAAVARGAMVVTSQCMGRLSVSLPCWGAAVGALLIPAASHLTGIVAGLPLFLLGAATIAASVAVHTAPIWLGWIVVDTTLEAEARILLSSDKHLC